MLQKAIEGIIASNEKVSVTINTTIMTDNLQEKLKELGMDDLIHIIQK